jgi:type II secretory pathway pseudopilin PulG
MKNEKGFALIQVLIAVSIAAMVAVGVADLISNQAKSVSYLEDKMSVLGLSNQLLMILATSGACTNSLAGKSASSDQLITQIKDKADNLVYDTNTNENKYDQLIIDKVTLKNIDVTGANSSGRMKLVIEILRIRKGGGPPGLKPISVEITVSTNGSNNIISCGAGGSTFTVEGTFTETGPFPWDSTCELPKNSWTLAGNIGAGKSCTAYVESFVSNYRYNSAGCTYIKSSGEIRICGGQTRSVVCRYACFD